MQISLSRSAFWLDQFSEIVYADFSKHEIEIVLSESILFLLFFKFNFVKVYFSFQKVSYKIEFLFNENLKILESLYFFSFFFRGSTDSPTPDEQTQLGVTTTTYTHTLLVTKFRKSKI